MPNWCENDLLVAGNQKTLASFKKKAHKKKSKDTEETELSLANLYPEPDYNKVEVKPTFPDITGSNKAVSPSQAWWDWRVQNWGTKWDVDADLLWEDVETIEYSFMSAWSPPVEWLRKVAKDYPTLSFRLKYEEPSIGFMGVAKAFGDNFTNQEIEL